MPTYSLTSARSLAPHAFRRWVLIGTLLTVIGYALVTLIDAREQGLWAALLSRNGIMAFVCAGAWLIAYRVNAVAGCALAILASWIEIETAFIGLPVFPAGSLLILPTLVLGCGLLLGSRVAFWFALLTIVTTIATALTSPQLRPELQRGLSTDTLYWFLMHTIAVMSVWILLALSLSAYGNVFEAMEAKESQRALAEEQRREMGLQLSHAQRLDAVGRLAGGLSHDFNNILTAVSGSAEMLRIEKDPKQRAELVDEIIAARDRGATLTRQLLAFARREVVQPRVIELASYVRGLERLLQRVAGDRQRLRFDLAPDCHVRVDPGQLEQALMNLVTNARDAMPDGGTCTISVSRASDGAAAARVLLRVMDDGVGMSPEIAEHAFEPFFTTKARGQGTGLGLAAVHGMAEQSDGVAYITSSPGRGTQVTLDLPQVDEAPSAGANTPVPSPLRTGAQTILVAEDDAGTRRVVERILVHAGYAVMAVCDGTEAMALVDSSTAHFDLVLSDVMMPGHTGPEIADRLRIVRPETPVLLMTGYAEEQLTELLDNRSGREIITKPFSADGLATRVAELLRVRVA